MADRRSWGVANGVLGVLLVVLVAATVSVVAGRPREDAGEASASAVSREYDALTAAATRETQAFLTVDYKDMAPTVERVLAGATGTFKKQYQKAEAGLRSAARRSRATSKGTVRAVGIGDLDGDSAVVYVAADSTVSNTSTGHRPEPRYYRFKLDMTRVEGRWLTAKLRFVP